jgi:hypothetical protein
MFEVVEPLNAIEGIADADFSAGLSRQGKKGRLARITPGLCCKEAAKRGLNGSFFQLVTLFFTAATPLGTAIAEHFAFIDRLKKRQNTSDESGDMKPALSPRAAV